ncbi:MBL fold metallo-hydrolase [Crocinitomix catalasitica]|nr:MBL fold metallo-hydrolase [Crocinitomix catalasitica]
MKVEQIYTGCLAAGAYYVASNGEALVIDPLRETAPYIERAQSDGVKIKYVMLTHFHADFVSGQVDLAKKTGATIVFGPGAQADYDFHEASDNEVFKIGDIEIHTIHTPGHTLESTTYLLKDEKGTDYCIFTGDTLFIGDVGRPDLAVKQGDFSVEDLAKKLYRSLRDRIMPLSDQIIVYPSHGAGSACGKNMSSETFDSLGSQKKMNYALRSDMTESEFVDEVLDGLVQPPAYFPKNVMMNKQVNPVIDDIIIKGSVPLNCEQFVEKVADGALMLDVRSQQEFVQEHIPGSIFIGLDGNFAPWVGALVTDINQAIVVIVEKGREEEAVTRLSRIGYDNSLGYLDGGLSAWKSENRETDSIKKVSPTEFEQALNEGANALDVRKPAEYETEHFDGIESLPLDFINESMNQIDHNKTYYVHCLGGYRSVIFESILKSRGMHQVIDIDGGFRAIKEETNLKMSGLACSSK